MDPGTRLTDRNGALIDDEDGFLLPAHRTFSSVWNSVSKTFPFTWDEALKHSRENALAMPRDAFLMGCLFERILQLAELPWHLEPENQKDSRQKAVTQELDHIVRATHRWIQFAFQMGLTTWYGRYGSQLDWRAEPVNGKKRLIVKGHQPIHGDKIQFGWHGTPRVMVNYEWIADHAWPGTRDHQWIENYSEKDALAQADDPAKPVIFGERGPMLILKDPRWRERFVIHKHMCIDADYFDAEAAGGIHGVGLRSLVYWFFWVRGEMIGWAINHLKKIGVGGILMFYYEEGNDAAKTAAENAARNAGERYALAMPHPRGQSKDVGRAELLPFNEAGVTALTGVVQDYYERHIERLIIGQTLSSKPAGGGLGDGTSTLHADTKYRILKFDACNLADTLTEDLVRVAQKWNFPREQFKVRFVFDVPDPQAAEKTAAATQVFQMGGKIVEADVMGMNSLRKAEDDDVILSQIELLKQQTKVQADAQQQQAQAQMQQQAAVGGAPGADAGASPGPEAPVTPAAPEAPATPEAPESGPPPEPPLSPAEQQLVQAMEDAGAVEYAWDEDKHNRDHGKFAAGPGQAGPADSRGDARDRAALGRVAAQKEEDDDADVMVSEEQAALDHERSIYERTGMGTGQSVWHDMTRDFIRTLVGMIIDRARRGLKPTKKMAAALRDAQQTLPRPQRGVDFQECEELLSYENSDQILTWYAATHAPVGGISIGGIKFVGGQFIPSKVLQNATPKEKAKLEQKTQAQGPPTGIPAQPQEQPAAPAAPAQPQEQEQPADAGEEAEAPAPPNQLVPDEQIPDVIRMASHQVKPEHHELVFAHIQRLARLSPADYHREAGRAYQRAAQPGAPRAAAAAALAARMVSRFRFGTERTRSSQQQIPPVSKAVQTAFKEGGKLAGALATVTGKHRIGRATEGWFGGRRNDDDELEFESKEDAELHKAFAKTGGGIVGRLAGHAVSAMPNFLGWLRGGPTHHQADAAPVPYADVEALTDRVMAELEE